MQISKKVVCMHTLWYGPDMTTICEASHNLESYVYTKKMYIRGGKVFLKIRKGQKNIFTEFMVALSSIIMAFVRGI